MSEYWIEAYRTGRRQHYPWDAVVTFVLRNAPRDRARGEVRVLEVGCGTGSNLWFAAREGFSVSGIDISPEAVAEAGRRLAAEGLSGDLRTASFEALPFPDAAFDLVIDRAALTCADMPTVRRALAEVTRVTSSGGRFFMNCYADSHSSAASGAAQGEGTVLAPDAGALAGYDRITFFSATQIRELLRDDWRIESMVRVEQVDFAQPGASIHAEWRVVASRV
jgi:SAM-dependent methyltransferase